MLSLSPRYKQLLHHARDIPQARAAAQFQPIVLAPHAYSIVGRAQMLDMLHNRETLLQAVQMSLAKAATKKMDNIRTTEAVAVARSVPAAGPAGGTRSAANEAMKVIDVPSWLSEMVQFFSTHANASCRYFKMEDVTHAGSVSRFHFIVKREQQHDEEGELHTRYFIKDLGSMNGLYINGIKLMHSYWARLDDGVLIRFAPTHRSTRHYFVERNQPRSSSSSLPLVLNDCYMELVFSQDVPKPVQHSAPAAAAAAPSSSVSRKRCHAQMESDTTEEEEKEEEDGNPSNKHISRRVKTEQQRGELDKSLLEEYSCGICSETIYQCVTLLCGHSYCRSCISEWFQRRKKKSCPECRTTHRGVLCATIKMDNTIALLVKNLMSEEDQAKRLEHIQSIQDAQSAALANSAAASAAVLPIAVIELDT